MMGRNEKDESEIDEIVLIFGALLVKRRAWRWNQARAK
jgi:hypothetical protein